MYIKEDYTYSEMRKNATIKWLNDLLECEDLVNRNSAKVALQHIDYLNKQIKELEDKNKLKDEFLKKLKNKGNQ